MNAPNRRRGFALGVAVGAFAALGGAAVVAQSQNTQPAKPGQSQPGQSQPGQTQPGQTQPDQAWQPGQPSQYSQNSTEYFVTGDEKAACLWAREGTTLRFVADARKSDRNKMPEDGSPNRNKPEDGSPKR